MCCTLYKLYYCIVLQYSQVSVIYLLLSCLWHVSYTMITCDIKLFQNYLSLYRRPSEIILFQRLKTCLKLFQIGLLQLMNIFQHVHCR